MKALLIAAVMAVFSWSAFAAECIKPEMVFADVRAKVPNVVTVADMGDQKDVTAFLSHLNALPPVTDFNADRVTIMYARGFTTVLILFFTRVGDGYCSDAGIQIPVRGFVKEFPKLSDKILDGA